MRLLSSLKKGLRPVEHELSASASIRNPAGRVRRFIVSAIICWFFLRRTSLFKVANLREFSLYERYIPVSIVVATASAGAFKQRPEWYAVDTAPKSPLGVLILHGFTSTGESVEALGRPLEALGIPFSIPLLRGHGAPSPEALRGVRWRQWLDDAEAAFEELSLKARRLVVVGHSMGLFSASILPLFFPGEWIHSFL